MKSLLSAALALATVTIVTAYDTDITEVETNFNAERIVPDVLPSVDFKLLLDLTFHYNGGHIITRTDLNLTQPVTSFLPSISIRNPDADVNLDSTFVLVAVDPDVPTPENKSLGEVLHYMGGGYKVSGNAERGLELVSDAAAVMPYFPAAPSNISLAHRYVWLIYESTDGFVDQTLVNANTSRLNFNLQSFAGSVGFADPLGGTFYFVSTNPSQVGTSTGILSASSTGVSSSSTYNSVHTTAVYNNQALASGSDGTASRIHLQWVIASVLVAPLFALLL